MAFVGLRKPFIGKRTDKKTYEEPFLFGKAIGVTINPSYAEGSLNADDEQAEYDKEFLYADITLNTNTIPLEGHEVMFGHEVTEKNVKFNKDDQANEVGIGWVSVEKVDGKRSFVGNFLYKAKFSEPSNEYATKGESIEYKTPSISGRASADEDGDWKEFEICESEEAAIAWILSMFGAETEAATVAEEPEAVEPEADPVASEEV